MTSSIPVVRPAIISVLKNSAGLIAISHDSDNKAPVYSMRGVPQGLAPPYTVVRSLQSAPPLDPRSASSFTLRAQELLLTLDTWSSFDGPDESEAMHKAIFDALDEQEENIQALLTGFTCTWCLFDTNDQIEDESTNIRLFHGVERYRLRTEAI